MYGEPLPDEIVLTRAEATVVLFALDGALEIDGLLSDRRRELERAVAIIVGKFLPDFEDL